MGGETCVSILSLKIGRFVWISKESLEKKEKESKYTLISCMLARSRRILCTFSNLHNTISNNQGSKKIRHIFFVTSSEV